MRRQPRAAQAGPAGGPGLSPRSRSATPAAFHLSTKVTDRYVPQDFNKAADAMEKLG
jgi:hypothetical protein